MPADHPSRIEAGIVFALNETINEGHVYAPQELLAQRAVELLEVPPELIPPALERLAQDNRIRPELIPLDNKRATSKVISESQGIYGTPVIYLTPLYFGEKGVAERIKALVGTTSKAINHVLFPAETLSAQNSDSPKNNKQPSTWL